MTHKAPKRGHRKPAPLRVCEQCSGPLPFGARGSRRFCDECYEQRNRASNRLSEQRKRDRARAAKALLGPPGDIECEGCGTSCSGGVHGQRRFCVGCVIERKRVAAKPDRAAEPETAEDIEAGRQESMRIARDQAADLAHVENCVDLRCICWSQSGRWPAVRAVYHQQVCLTHPPPPPPSPPTSRP